MMIDYEVTVTFKYKTMGGETPPEMERISRDVPEQISRLLEGCKYDLAIKRPRSKE
jgi:hypothetical protein